MLFAIPCGMSQCGNCLRRSRPAALGLVGRSFACWVDDVVDGVFGN
jgi:hypothetical protein